MAIWVGAAAPAGLPQYFSGVSTASGATMLPRIFYRDSGSQAIIWVNVTTPPL
jgi:hypothetical protein